MKNSRIRLIEAKEILDSKGIPTIEVELMTDSGKFSASVPSGTSTGKYEAVELRDENGKGVSKAIKNINEIISPELEGKDASNQKEIDDLMVSLDGTENKSKLGANAILAVSMVVCRAAAGSQKNPLYRHIAKLAGRKDDAKNQMPLAMFNILNGGAHAKNNLDIQEFMVIPQKKTFVENLIVCNKIFQNLKELVKKITERRNWAMRAGLLRKFPKQIRPCTCWKTRLPTADPKSLWTVRLLNFLKTVNII